MGCFALKAMRLASSPQSSGRVQSAARRDPLGSRFAFSRAGFSEDGGIIGGLFGGVGERRGETRGAGVSPNVCSRCSALLTLAFAFSFWAARQRACRALSFARRSSIAALAARASESEMASTAFRMSLHDIPVARMARMIDPMSVIAVPAILRQSCQPWTSCRARMRRPG